MNILVISMCYHEPGLVGHSLLTVEVLLALSRMWSRTIE
jgi:hypothetical protein